MGLAEVERYLLFSGCYTVSLCFRARRITRLYLYFVAYVHFPGIQQIRPKKPNLDFEKERISNQEWMELICSCS